MNINIDGKWCIRTDEYNFVLLKAAKKSYKVVGYYPGLDYLLEGLLRNSILTAKCKDFKELKTAICEIKKTIESIGARIDLRKYDGEPKKRKRRKPQK